MDTSKITTSLLKSFAKLEKKRDELLSNLAKVELAIKKAAAPVSTGRRGALKDSIIAVLQSVGLNGISVKELSDKLGVKNQNVHVWFSTTGRKLESIQKVGSGKYGWKA